MSGVSAGSRGAAAADAAQANSGESSGEGSNSAAARRENTRTLDDVVREPSRLPDVVVLDAMPEGLEREEILDPKEDLWLSTADGRYNSPIIPIRVGQAPYIETFYVHKPILLKSVYFEKALCGDFVESSTQSIDLPEENPAIFHFLVAYLYEGKYVPIKPIASVLVPDQDKGKGKDTETGADSDSDESAGSYASDISARSRRRRDRRRRREDRHWARTRQKHPGSHRPNCNCQQCLSALGPPCWSCAAPRAPPPPAPPHHPPGVVVLERDHGYRDRHRRQPQPLRRRGAPAGPPTPPPPPGARGTGTGDERRIAEGEDMRTWLLAYELNIDVYILANKFLLDGLKTEVARVAIDMLETAGSDASVPEVLFLCRKLYEGLPESDELLKMIFARAGFLQPWRQNPAETQDFLVSNPEIASLLLREMAARREDDFGGRTLPSMERPWFSGNQQMDPVMAQPYRHGAPLHPHQYRHPRW
ncbi:hypothetical protein QBC46DRAFT_100806 [Diplogelasinospora grovesii]|uniref:BTB domain-containing protein n=1 Tax=Diplogelasinospora grovesii TaxID=303347 RepID=A0AAN6N9B6_9PEZI|nr:hypothetical protein QBC46DRAFT_100806 [Diplogelasinospora grovesii]